MLLPAQLLYQIFDYIYLDINDTTASVIKKRDDLKMEDQGDFIDKLRMMIHKIRESGQAKLDGVNEEMVIAQGIIFLTAGFETTANTLGTLTYNLAKYPEIQQRCYEEILEVIENRKEINHETISELHYLEACIKVCYTLNPLSCIMPIKYLHEEKMITIDCL